MWLQLDKKRIRNERCQRQSSIGQSLKFGESQQERKFVLISCLYAFEKKNVIIEAWCCMTAGPLSLNAGLYSQPAIAAGYRVSIVESLWLWLEASPSSSSFVSLLSGSPVYPIERRKIGIAPCWEFGRMPKSSIHLSDPAPDRSACMIVRGATGFFLIASLIWIWGYLISQTISENNHHSWVEFMVVRMWPLAKRITRLAILGAV